MQEITRAGIFPNGKGGRKAQTAENENFLSQLPQIYV
jgi:hypothetical protein